MALLGGSLGVIDATAASVTFTTLYAFTGGADGSKPVANLLLGRDGNFYGTTLGGGSYGGGTVFKITETGLVTTLYSFAGGDDGAQPYGGLVQGTNTFYYGITAAGGKFGAGTVYRISASGTFTALYSFNGPTDGSQSHATPVLGGDGNLYGTTTAGGPYNFGTIFKISVLGVFTPLFAFKNDSDGGQPFTGLTLGPDGDFYGVADTGGGNGVGNVFKITSTGTYTNLRAFNGGNGAYPYGPLMVGSDGSFYGTTYGGGSGGLGTVFKMTPDGTLTTLRNFDGSNGAGPSGIVVESTDRNLYVPTFRGATYGAGVICKIDLSTDSKTTLYTFTNSYDGRYPVAGLTAGSSITNYLGVTSEGGAYNAGTVYSLLIPCNYSLSPTQVSLPAVSNTGTFTVFGGTSNCLWSASSNVSWITFPNGADGVQGGAGDGMVTYAITENNTANSRTGKITVAKKTFTITQQAQVNGQFLQGTYNGLVSQNGNPTEATSGYITLSLSKTASFSATITLAGVKTSFKGLFDVTGNSTNNVPRGSLNPLTVIMNVAAITNGTDLITGTVSDGTFTSSLLADLAIYSTSNPCPWAGYYTLLLPPADPTNASLPQGVGYGTITVSTSGSAKLQGYMGDGNKLNFTAPVSAFGTWPLYNVLYKNLGAATGWVTFSPDATSANATVDWFKPPVSTDKLYPAGFTTAVPLTGALYVAPTAGGPPIAATGPLTLSGGNLISNIVKQVTIATNGVCTVADPGADKLTVKVNTSTGQFSGSFINNGTGKSTSFLGELLQPASNAGGYFTGPTQTGSATFTPAH